MPPTPRPPPGLMAIFQVDLGYPVPVCLLVYLLAKCHVYSQFYVRPLDLCSACLVVLQCQQPCMTRSTG